MKRFRLATILLLALTAGHASVAEAQYAVGHRVFGGGTAFGGGYMRSDFQFPGIEPGRWFPLLPTIELKVFLGDLVSIDLSVPVVNIAASNALQKHFFFTGEAFVNFHPNAPSTFELFVAPGVGLSYAAWESDDGKSKENAWAFHIPVRVGMEFSNARRTFSFTTAVRPFFSLVHGGSGGNNAGGGVFLELGLNAYAVKYTGDRY
ncbi:MAG: hypothetical protein IT371_24200 [Deltaproteobacteria bacterium]|nr:hypothetical protein [Deltaproteobacteria bacterium]